MFPSTLDADRGFAALIDEGRQPGSLVQQRVTIGIAAVMRGFALINIPPVRSSRVRRASSGLLSVKPSKNARS